jgi:hypothetical protein
MPSDLIHRAHARALPALCFLLAGAGHALAASPDTIRFGDGPSEQAHHLVARDSDIVQGPTGERARRLLRRQPGDWRGGSVVFDLAIDPQLPNYVTLTLWGGEENPNRLQLTCDGKQIGARHLGDTDMLDIGSVAPMKAGRFFHNTSPLPPSLTAGKRKLACRIDATGTIWPYGLTFEQFQKPMTAATRGMYALTAHTDPFLEAGALERNGQVVQPGTRPAPGPEVLDQVKERAGHAVDAALASTRPLTQAEMLMLARAYDIAWTHAHRNPEVMRRIVEGMDNYVRTFSKHPDLVYRDASTFNPGWFGLGQAAWSMILRAGEMQAFLDRPVGGDGASRATRRAAYADMMVKVRDWQRTHRRFYTNQSMIADTYGIYLTNRGIALLDPARAFPEKDAKRYLYEAAGLEPWRGDDLPDGGHRYGSGGPDGTAKGAYRVDTGYRQVTGKGLTRELGYVGNYGEVLDWVAAMYEATRPSADQPGDPRILAQLLKISHARAFFRYPLVDADGYRAMALESVIGWRDVKYPGDIVYGQRPTWDASAIEVAAITRDPAMVAYAQQMFDDNQFFRSLVEQMKTNSLRVNAGLLQVPGQYASLQGMPRVNQRLPMSAGQPDCVFTDEENGVVAVKAGDDILYATLYWRALNAVNGLARVHHVTPLLDRIAVVREETKFKASGRLWTRPAERLGGIDPRFAKFAYPDNVEASAGETLPVADYPAGVVPEYGGDSPYAGKARFYVLHYGPFTIAMNTTVDQRFEMTAPARERMRDLVARRRVAPGEHVVVPPRSTVVLYTAPEAP